LSIPTKRGVHSREIDTIPRYGLDDSVIARQAGKNKRCTTTYK